MVGNYRYDQIGQLKTAQGLESDGTTPRLHEQFGYERNTRKQKLA